jgi:hypothetical protein
MSYPKATFLKKSSYVAFAGGLFPEPYNINQFRHQAESGSSFFIDDIVIDQVSTQARSASTVFHRKGDSNGKSQQTSKIGGSKSLRAFRLIKFGAFAVTKTYCYAIFLVVKEQGAPSSIAPFVIPDKTARTSSLNSLASSKFEVFGSNGPRVV